MKTAPVERWASLRPFGDAKGPAGASIDRLGFDGGSGSLDSSPDGVG